MKCNFKQVGLLWVLWVFCFSGGFGRGGCCFCLLVLVWGFFVCWVLLLLLGVLAKWMYRHWFLLNLGKSCFDFRGLQKTACPDLLLGVCCQSLLLQGGTLSVGINLKSKFPEVTDISTSPEHLWEATLHSDWWHLSHSWASLQNWYLTTPGKTTDPRVTDLSFLHWEAQVLAASVLEMWKFEIKLDSQWGVVKEVIHCGFFLCESCGENWKIVCVGEGRFKRHL